MSRTETSPVSLDKWLEKLENEFKNYQDVYQQRKEQEGNGQSQSSFNLADFYYKKTLENYIALIQIARKVSVTNVLKLIATPNAAIVDLILFIDARRFVPRLFHLRFNEKTKKYEMHPDKNCYELALMIRAALDDLSLIPGEFFNLIKGQYNDRLTKILSALKNRIQRYEFNLHFLQRKEESDEYDEALSQLTKNIDTKDFDKKRRENESMVGAI